METGLQGTRASTRMHVSRVRREYQFLTSETAAASGAQEARHSRRIGGLAIRMLEVRGAPCEWLAGAPPLRLLFWAASLQPCIVGAVTLSVQCGRLRDRA